MGEFMKTMYKEEIMRKRLPVILEMFALLVLTIFISDLIEKIRVANRSIGIITNPVLIIFMGIMLILSIVRCSEKYRYSIIADQLIVHRIIKGEQIVVENIKLKDIKYIGRASRLKEKLDIKYTKRHGCSIFAYRRFCCIYKDGNSMNKFYFGPSENFISKVVSFLESEKKVS
jgi:hypothetical protein